MHHYRKTRKVYFSHNTADKKQTGGCPFPSCSEKNQQETLGENDTMYIIANRVSYDMFEGRRVEDHLMVIPKRHVETVADFTNQEKIDQMTIIGDYESKGYSVYARGVGSISRSVKHQHTHLIKLANVNSKLIVYARKPYFLVDF